MKLFKKKIIQLVVSLLLLTTGGMLYLLFRTPELIMFKWANVFGIDTLIFNLRELTKAIILPNFIKYSLPNMLWLLSYMLVIDYLWKNDSKKQIIWVSLMLTISLLSEFLQVWKFFPGTYDPIDILAYLMAPVIFIVFKVTFKNAKKNMEFQFK